MTTILPEKNKVYIKNQYIKGFMVRLLAYFVALSFVWLIFEGTIYYIIDSQKKVLEKQYTDENNQEKTNLASEYKNKLSESKQLIKIFDKTIKNKNEIIDFIFDNKTDSIQINNISSEDGEKVVFVGVGGIASNRDALFEFQKLLEESSQASQVDLPVSSFTKTFDIPFTITFVYNNE